MTMEISSSHVLLITLYQTRKKSTTKIPTFHQNLLLHENMLFACPYLCHNNPPFLFQPCVIL